MAGKANNILPFNSQAVLKAGVRNGKRTEWRVDGVRGLVLFCQPSGVATWFFFYMAKLGTLRKLRKIKIGGRDTWTLAGAKAKAVDMLRVVEAGGDPVAETKAKRASTTFSELAELRLANDQNLATSTRKSYGDLLKSQINPVIGDVPASEVTRAMVAAILDKIEARGSRRTCDLVKTVIGSTYKWAMKRGGGIDSDPTTGLGKRSPTGARNRVLTELELSTFWKALDDDSAPLSKPMRLILKLALLTGQRRSEVAGVCRSELNLDAAKPMWTIAGDTRSRGKVVEGRTKNGKEQVLPLSTQAVALLREALAECADRVHLFPAHMGSVKFGKHPRTAHINGESVSKAVRRLRSDANTRTTSAAERQFQESYRLEDVTTHDMRRCISTWLGNQGVRPDVIDLILNHLPAATDVTRKHYNFATLEGPVRQAMQAWADHVSQITGDQAIAGGNVVAFGKLAS